LLQCIPLIGAASCVANGVSNQRLTLLPLVLWWCVLVFGLGYEHLGLNRRWVVTAIAGPAIAFGSCVTSFAGVSYDYEHCDPSMSSTSANGDKVVDLAEIRYRCGGIAGADRAAIETGLIVAAVVLLMAVDAWRLAKQQNLDIEALERGQPDGGLPE